MADTKTATENTQQPELVNIEYTLLKNIKYGDKIYKIDEKIDIKKEDIDEFKKAGAIRIE